MEFQVRRWNWKTILIGTAGVFGVLLGATGIGATIYFGAEESRRQMQEISAAFEEAHQLGLFTVLWCYLRNDGFKVDGVDYHAAADTTAAVSARSTCASRLQCCQYSATSSDCPGASSTSSPRASSGATSTSGFMPQPRPCTAAWMKPWVPGTRCCGGASRRL